MASVLLPPASFRAGLAEEAVRAAERLALAVLWAVRAALRAQELVLEQREAEQEDRLLAVSQTSQRGRDALIGAGAGWGGYMGGIMPPMRGRV